MNTNALCDKIGYKFNDVSLLMTALTHPSYAGEHHVKHYQRLEFLGDAVLELTVSRVLFRELPDVDEGKLTRIRAHIVREETLYQAALKINLGQYIRFSMGEERTGGRDKPSILADVMESVLAAIYLDGGLDAASAFVTRMLGDEMKPQALKDHMDAKSKLQEKLQKLGKSPRYEFVDVQGPPHAPRFTYRVYVDTTLLGEGSGTSKQNAQQEAAKKALTAKL